MKPQHPFAFNYLALMLCVFLVGCAVGLQRVDEDKAMGRQVAQEVASSMGIYDDPQLASYLDAVGRRLLAAQSGYDPESLATALDRLDQESRLITGKQHKASFFDTHPMTPDRIERLTRDARNIEWTRQQGVAGDTHAYLRRLDGLLVGPDPALGIISERQLLQPALDFAVTFPQGWQVVNSRQAAIAIAPDKEALLLMSIAGKDITPQQAAAELAQALEDKYGVKPSISRDLKVGSNPGHLVTYTDDSGREPMDTHFLWFAYRGLLYQYVGLGPERMRPILRDAAFSFRPLTKAERSGIKALRMRVVAAKDGETLRQLSGREHNAWNMETTAVINGIDAGQPLSTGQLVKIAVLTPYSGPAYMP